MKFLVPNYSCLQNPWLRGYRPQNPVLSVLCPQLNLLNPPPKKNPGYATSVYHPIYIKLNTQFLFSNPNFTCRCHLTQEWTIVCLTHRVTVCVRYECTWFMFVMKQQCVYYEVQFCNCTLLVLNSSFRFVGGRRIVLILRNMFFTDGMWLGILAKRLWDSQVRVFSRQLLTSVCYFVSKSVT